MVKIEIGSLDKRVSFVGMVEGENEIGQTILIPTAIKTVWARIEPVRGREYYEAKKLTTEKNYKITTRYHDGVTTDMFIRFKEQEFEIKDIINPYLANKSLEFMCVEKVEKDG